MTNTSVAKVALVTGGASGIGRASAEEMTKLGFRVTIADIDEPRAAAVAEKLVGASAVRVDVSDAGAMQGVADALVDSAGRIDALITSAGVVSATALLETSPEDWEHVMSVNVGGVFNACRAVLPAMLAQGSGAIVNVASVAGLVALPSRAAYCAAKGAVISLTRSIAIDYVDAGVRANCVCPGSIDTPWVERLLASSETPEQLLAEIVARQPMGRLGQPGEIAKAIAYLANDDAAFITGSALVIDGGLTSGLLRPNISARQVS